MDNQTDVEGATVVEVKESFFRRRLKVVKDFYNRCMTWLLSRTMSTKQLYFTLIVLSIIYQLYTLLSDFRYHYKLLNYNFPSRRHTLSVMILHVATFYWSLLAAIYSFQCSCKRLGYSCVVAVFLNLATFLTRCIFEFMMLQYREEIY